MTTPDPFNAKKARTKYALPLWVDAFVRDTLDLSGDEIGAFNLILWAMWTRDSCDLPDDNRKLARVARATSQTWKRRIRPALEPFFQIENDAWSNTRLRKEAAKTEKFLQGQSDRKRGQDNGTEPFTRHGGAQLGFSDTQEKSPNPLENNNVGSTADNSPDGPRHLPTQETKYIIAAADSAPARNDDFSGPETFREKLLSACLVDPVSGLTGHGANRLGDQPQMIAANRWISDLGLTEPEILAKVTEVMQRKRDGPPGTLTYFDGAMKRLAGQLREARSKPMQPDTITGGPNGKSASRRDEQSAVSEYIRRTATGEINRGPDPSDPFAGG